jgi:hypothetical protein
MVQPQRNRDETATQERGIRIVAVWEVPILALSAKISAIFGRSCPRLALHRLAQIRNGHENTGKPAINALVRRAAAVNRPESFSRLQKLGLGKTGDSNHLGSVLTLAHPAGGLRST